MYIATFCIDMYIVTFCIDMYIMIFCIYMHIVTFCIDMHILTFCIDMHILTFQPPRGPGSPNLARAHDHTNSVELLWTSDQPVTETST